MKLYKCLVEQPVIVHMYYGAGIGRSEGHRNIQSVQNKVTSGRHVTAVVMNSDTVITS